MIAAVTKRREEPKSDCTCLHCVQTKYLFKMIKKYLRQVNLCKQSSRCQQQDRGCQARALITQQAGSCRVGTGNVVLSDWHQAVAQAMLLPEENYLIHLSFVPISESF